MGTLRYQYLNQPWVEIPADSYTLVTEQAWRQIPTGRIGYYVYAQWVSNGWYPFRVDYLGLYYSWCPAIPNLVFNGQGGGVVHYWAHLSVCNNPNGVRTNPRISGYGSWGNIWVGSTITETYNQLQSRCNIHVIRNGQLQIIEGVWGEVCPQVQFIVDSCLSTEIQCPDPTDPRGFCCIPCSVLDNKIKLAFS